MPLSVSLRGLSLVDSSQTFFRHPVVALLLIRCVLPRFLYHHVSVNHRKSQWADHLHQMIPPKCIDIEVAFLDMVRHWEFRNGNPTQSPAVSSHSFLIMKSSNLISMSYVWLNVYSNGTISSLVLFASWVKLYLILIIKWHSIYVSSSHEILNTYNKFLLEGNWSFGVAVGSPMYTFGLSVS